MEVPTATWTVVQFVEDKTVEAVPTNWLDGDKCYWPPLQKAKLNHAIKKLEPPQPTWIKFTVKSFRNGIFNDYAKARKKAKEAEETSDLQSEVDKSGVPRKRKIYRPSWATSSEDLSSDDTMLPSPPSLKRKPKIVAATSKESPSLLKRSRPFERRQQEAEEPESFSTIVAATSKESPSLLKRSRPFEIRQQEADEPESFSTIENRGTPQLEKIEGYCKAVLEQQHLLRNILTDVLDRLRILEERFNEEERPHSNRGSRSLFNLNIVFPINCEEDLQEIEKYLQDENNFSDAVSELATVGGTNNYNFVKRVMTTLITNRFGTQYSWLGRKGKKMFHTLKLTKIIIDAAEKSGMSKTKKETEISIQAWLRRAMERSKVVVKDL